MRWEFSLILLILLSLIFYGCVQENKPPIQFPEKPPIFPKPEEKIEKIEKSHFSGIGGVRKANWIRFFVFWNDVEREKGIYDFSELDTIIRALQYGDRAILLTIMPYANWDQDICHGDEYYSTLPTPKGEVRVKVGKPCNMTAYLKFLEAVVERYDGDGFEDLEGLRYGIKYWEIMNEPAIQGQNEFNLRFFAGSPREYLEILKESYKTIKKADPEAKVLMAGMASMEPRFVEFWDEIMDEAKDYFDIANVHSITTSGEREDLYLIKFKEFLGKHGINKEIWITEVQYGDLFNPPENIKEVEKLIVRSTVFALANGAEKVFHIGNWYEFWKSDSTQRVYETLVDELDYFDKVEIIKQKYKRTREGVRTEVGQYKFTIGDRVVYVLWGKAKLPKEIKGKVEVVDIYGDRKVMNSTEISLSDEPVYIHPKY